MPGIVKVYSEDLDITYEAVVANVVGGNLVIPDATATSTGEQGAKPAGLTALNCLGVAAKDAVTAANRAALEQATGPAPLGAFVTDISVPDCTFTVYNNCIAPVVYAALSGGYVYRDPLKCAASGAVTKWVEGTDSQTARIGWCAQKGGVGAGGGVGRARINV